MAAFGFYNAHSHRVGRLCAATPCKQARSLFRVRSSFWRFPGLECRPASGELLAQRGSFRVGVGVRLVWLLPRFGDVLEQHAGFVQEFGEDLET